MVLLLHQIWLLLSVDTKYWRSLVRHYSLNTSKWPALLSYLATACLVDNDYRRFKLIIVNWVESILDSWNVLVQFVRAECFLVSRNNFLHSVVRQVWYLVLLVEIHAMTLSTLRIWQVQIWLDTVAPLLFLNLYLHRLIARLVRQFALFFCSSKYYILLILLVVIVV